MIEDALVCLGHADFHLRELSQLSVEHVWGSVIHSAYYSIFHARHAVIAICGIERPRTHSGLRAQFSLVTTKEITTLASLTSILGRAFDARMLADYDPNATGLRERAAELKTSAPKFVEACRTAVNARLEPPSS